MVAKKYLCQICEDPIPKERSDWSLLHGRDPMYCSDVCARRAASRAAYYRKAESAKKKPGGKK